MATTKRHPRRPAPVKQAPRVNFRGMELGTQTEQGIIALCPHCNQRGAYSEPRWAGNMILFIHFGTLSDAGRFQMSGTYDQKNPQRSAYHLIPRRGYTPKKFEETSAIETVEETPRSDVFSFNGRRIICESSFWKFGHVRAVEVEPVPQVIEIEAPAPVETPAPAPLPVVAVPSWRAAAAKKAWIKIRANRAAAALTQAAAA